MDSTILLISRHDEDLRFASEIARACRSTLLVEPDLTRARPLMERVSTHSILVDISPSQQLQEFEELFANKIGKNRVHSIASPHQLSKMDTIFRSPTVGHLIIRNYENPEWDGRHYSRIILATNRSHPFGLSSLLSEKSVIRKIEIGESSQKSRVTHAVSRELLKFGCIDRIAVSIATALDELIMNAIYDAQNQNGMNRNQSGIYRTENVSLIEKRAIEVYLGTEDDYVAVSVTDLAGSLDRAKVLHHVAKSYSGKQTVDPSNRLSGAGLGLALILRSGGSLCFANAPGEKTEVTVFFRRAKSFRRFKKQFRFVSTQLHSYR